MTDFLRPKSRFSFTFLLLFASFFVRAQNYRFIRYELNKITAGSGKPMAGFYAGLHELENGKKRKVRIVHIGDSHIQADRFSGHLRTLLQAKFGNGGRGFMFPYTAAHTNNPSDYEVSVTGSWQGKSSIDSRKTSRWGLSGITAVTFSESSGMQIRAAGKPDFRFRKIRIYHPVFDRKSFHPYLSVDKNNIASVYRSREGFTEFILKKPITKLKMRLLQTEAVQNYFIMQGLYAENERPGIVYHAIGLNGAKTDTYFRCRDFVSQLASLEADLIILSLGTNDAYAASFDREIFKKNYRSILADIRKSSPEASVLLSTPGDSYSRGKKNLRNAEARAVILEVAAETGTAVWDFYELMGGFGSIHFWQQKGLAKDDRLHFKTAGYRLQAELLFKALMSDFRRR